MGLNKCCCCVSLRAGCIILAVVGIIVNFGFFGFADSRCPNGQCSDDFYVITVGNIIGIIGCACLLFGSIKYNRIGVLVYLVVEIIQIFLYFANAVMIFIAYAYALNSLENTLLAGYICVLVVLLLSVFFCTCVFSFFQKIGDSLPNSRV